MPGGFSSVKGGDDGGKSGAQYQGLKGAYLVRGSYGIQQVLGPILTLPCKQYLNQPQFSKCLGKVSFLCIMT